jgi:hypothetical protein
MAETGAARVGGAARLQSARAMQDRVGLAIPHFVQQLTYFHCGCRYNLDATPFRHR